MTEQELFEQVCSRLNFPREELLVAAIEEACESTCNPVEAISDEEKVITAMSRLNIALHALKGSVTAGLQHADIITLNYRDRSFRIGSDHWLLSLGEERN